MMMTVAQCYRQSPQALSSQLPWLIKHQQQAYQHLKKIGWPTRKTEEWRYTDVNALTSLPLRLAMPQTQEHTAGHAIRLRGETLTLPSQLPTGLTVLPLAQGLATFTQCQQQLLSSAAQQWYELANTTYLSSGWVIHLAADVTLSSPLEIVIQQGQQPIAQHCQVVIIAETGAKLPIVTRFDGRGDQPYLNNYCCRVMLASGAAINMLSIANETSKGYQLAKLQVSQQADSHFSHHSFMGRGAMLRQDIDVSLMAAGACCTLNGFYTARDQQHQANYTSVSHLAPHTQSQEWYKGVVTDSAQAVFRGRVYVAEDAQKTQASQRNNNLLLSPKAEIDTKPQLEIYADDVKCAHGATVGQLDEAALFYLRSRGIEAADATALLVNAFVAEIIQQLDPPFRSLSDSLTQQFLLSEERRDVST